MHVRRAVADDADAVVELCREAHADSCYCDVDFSDFYARKTFHAMERRSDATVLLLCDGDTVCGIMGGHLEPAYFCAQYDATETLLYIAKNHRKGENARMLIEAFERWATANGAAGVQLSVSQLNRAPSVSAFYGTLGYSVSAFVHRREL